MNDSKTIKGQTVFLADLAKGKHAIEGWTFIECQIQGPMVVAFLDAETTLDQSNLGGTQEQVLWEIPDERRSIWGALGLSKCRFERCRFRNVGFAGRPDAIRRWRLEVDWNPN